MAASPAPDRGMSLKVEGRVVLCDDTRMGLSFLRRPRPAEQLLVFLAFAGVVGGVVALGALLMKPQIAALSPQIKGVAALPPHELIRYGTLAAMGGLALGGFLTWREARGFQRVRWPMALFGVQLVLTVLWGALFFAGQAFTGAFFAALTIVAMVALMASSFYRHSRLAAALIVPYLVVASFAAYVNAEVVRSDLSEDLIVERAQPTLALP